MSPLWAVAASMSKEVQEQRFSNGANGSASASVSIRDQVASKETGKCISKKLSLKQRQQPTSKSRSQPDKQEDQANEFAKDKMSNQGQKPAPSRNQSRRRQSCGRADYKDNESIASSDVSHSGGGSKRRNRNRNTTKQRHDGNSGPLNSIGEDLPGKEAVNDATSMTQSMAGNTVGKLTGGGEKSESKEEGRRKRQGEQLRLRLELGLDIEFQLKAKIHGDLTLGLLN